MAHIRLKVNLTHDPRNQDVPVSQTEKRVERGLNHPNDLVSRVRIANGHAAGAIFLHLESMKWYANVVDSSKADMQSIARQAVMFMDRAGYATDLRIENWCAEAVSES